MSFPEDLEPESPKECLAKYRVDSLSIQELLAVLLFPRYNRKKAIEIAANLLKTLDGELIDLFTATTYQLSLAKGIGFVKACKIRATFELVNRTESYCEEVRSLITRIWHFGYQINELKRLTTLTKLINNFNNQQKRK